MARRMTINFGAIGDAMRQQGVRDAIHDHARAIASRARSIDAAEGGNASIGVSSGTNGRGRPYSRITSNDVGGEFGSSKTARRRTLGRAAEQGG
jgi:hypothetical protein